jgi:hypothetical protein
MIIYYRMLKYNNHTLAYRGYDYAMLEDTRLYIDYDTIYYLVY